MAGEFDFISWIRSQQQPSELVALPAGDDLAILRWKADDLLLVGVDQVLDGVHFDSRVHSPRLIGRKVMNRNLSDCAAMACLPAAAVIAVALKKGTPLDYSQELYLGIQEAAGEFGCKIVGGDTASWDGQLAVTVTILGRSAGNTPVTRSGARVGDTVFVTGDGLGGSILGRHMTFQPRVQLGFEIGKSGMATAMIDLSDGLSRDLRHVCQQSGVGAVIDAASVPIHADVRRLKDDAMSALDHALHDGEDYELLLTASADQVPGCTAIGRVTTGTDTMLSVDGRLIPLEPRGWEHRL